MLCHLNTQHFGTIFYLVNGCHYKIEPFDDQTTYHHLDNNVHDFIRIPTVITNIIYFCEDGVYSTLDV